LNIYQQQILEHYKNPHNLGEQKNATCSALSQNTSCGDEINIFLTIEANKVKNATFTGDYIKGKSINDLSKFKSKNHLQLLGIELTPNRQKCALVSFESLKTALKKIG